MNLEVSIVIPFFKENNEFKLWVQKRESKDNLQGRLEFPGGKIEADESALYAAKRELAEETGISIEVDEIEGFKVFKFDNLIINVFLNHDKKNLFSSESYYSISHLLSGDLNILPNNYEILRELDSYFQSFKE